MVVLLDDSDILVEAEDGVGKEERLGDVVKSAQRVGSGVHSLFHRMTTFV